MTTTLAASLERVRFEVIPMKGVADQLRYLPDDALVTVTASPTKGIQPTLDLARTITAAGHRVVPHLSARLIAGSDHLDDVLGQLDQLAVKEVFVIAGDAPEAAGPYEGAGDLLEAIDAKGTRFELVGISGYPESHAFIPDEATVAQMARKAPYATHIVSQICYDPDVLRAWVYAVRARGIHLPIFIGLPGVIDRARLLRVSVRVGLGDSVRFLSKQSQVATRMLAGYQPDELMTEITDLLDDPVARVHGWHLFTFNEVERTERWRQELLATTRGAAL